MIRKHAQRQADGLRRSARIAASTDRASEDDEALAAEPLKRTDAPRPAPEPASPRPEGPRLPCASDRGEARPRPLARRWPPNVSPNARAGARPPRERPAATTRCPPSPSSTSPRREAVPITLACYEKGRILQAKCQEFGGHGHREGDPPGARGHDLRVQARRGIKYSKIVGLSDDLALALEAESIRIDRISGKGNVGIEIPNEARETISLREVLEADLVPPLRRAA